MYHLPTYYDTLNTPGTSEDISLYTRIAKRYGRHPHTWLEPACGTGRHLRVLSRRGYKAWGFDTDDEMLQYARESLKRRRLSAHIYNASMSDFIDPIRQVKFDVAINPHSSIRHLLVEEDAVSHLNQMACCLSPGGLYIVGISLARYAHDRDETDLWLAARGRMHIKQQITYKAPRKKERAEQVHSRLTISRPNGTEAHSDSYTLRSYDAAQWDRLIGNSRLQKLVTLDENGTPAENKELQYQVEILSPR